MCLCDCSVTTLQLQLWSQLTVCFVEGLILIEEAMDGACLFATLARREWNDGGEGKQKMRQILCNYIENHPEIFAKFFRQEETEEESAASCLEVDFESDDDESTSLKTMKEYLFEMRQDSEWGDHIIIYAYSQCFG